MRRFRDKSIKQKLTLIIMGTASAALLLACASFLTYEYLAAPRVVAQNLSSLAMVVGTNSTAAIAFNDENAASETLAALRATPNIAWAYIFKKDGSVFAGYDREGHMNVTPQCHPDTDDYRVLDNRVELCRNIVLRGENLGSISVGSDLGEIKKRVRGYSQIVTAVLLVSLIVAFLISAFLQRTISAPILYLANLARQISSEQNYSVRATKQSDNEIGILVDGFNAMLTQIESRDLALQKAQAQLEERVAELQREVAERKRAEKNLAERSRELQRSNSELEQFAYVSSHDLQEPLRMVSSYTQLLVKRYGDRLDETAHEFIHYAIDGVKRMQTLILDLLEFSRVGTRGKSFEPVSCDAILQSTLLNLSASLRETEAVVTRDALPVILGDEVQLVQLFQNLIGNAIKYRSAARPRVHVSCEQGEISWLFSVKDNGIGMDPRYAERIFVIFQRLHTRENYPGTGIGLAICKKIVERHGGRIWVDAQPAKGSTFFFTIPYGPESGQEAVA